MAPRHRVGARNSVTSCDLGVFVEEAAEPVASDDLDVGVDGVRERPSGLAWFSARCGRCPLKWDSYSDRTLRRRAALMMNIRSRLSRRTLPAQQIGRAS